MKKYLLAILTTMPLLVGCSNEEEMPALPEGEGIEVATKPLVLTSAEVAAAEQVRDFGSKFLKAMCAVQDDRNRNMIVSPLSAQITLSMLANACDEQGAKEITDALGCDDVNALNALSGNYMRNLSSVDPNTTLNLVNALWYDNTYSIKPGVESVLSDVFSIKSFGMDFGNHDGVVSAVNKWCATNTKNMIPKILDDFNPDLPLILGNALYFDGRWTDRFDVSDTRSGVFRSVNGNQFVRMMHKTMSLNVYYGTDYFAAEFPFGKEHFNMIIVLPDEGVDMESFVAGYSLDDMMRNPYKGIDDPEISATSLPEQNLYVSLPKFEFLTEIMPLNEALSSLGVSSALNGHADFFSDGRFGDLKMSQRTATSIDEGGAKAASVTIIEGDLAPSPPPTIDFTVDRPFLFFITEKSTGVSLIAGKIVSI